MQIQAKWHHNNHMVLKMNSTLNIPIFEQSCNIRIQVYAILAKIARLLDECDGKTTEKKY